MPLYEYECDDCGHRFELIQKFSDKLESICPECKGNIRKLISSSAIQFKGTGWYVTDYAKKSEDVQPPPSSSDKKSDKKTDKKTETKSNGSSTKNAATDKSKSKTTSET